MASKEVGTMNVTPACVVAGLVLGVAASQGVVAFLLSLPIGLAGLLVGLYADGRLNIDSVFGRGRG